MPKYLVIEGIFAGGKLQNPGDVVELENADGFEGKVQLMPLEKAETPSTDLELEQAKADNERLQKECDDWRKQLNEAHAAYAEKLAAEQEKVTALTATVEEVKGQLAVAEKELAKRAKK